MPDALAKALRPPASGVRQSTVQARLDSIAIKRGEPSAAAQESVDVSDVEAEDTMQELIDHGDNPECPDCGTMLSLQEGCIKCQSCGYSEC